MTKEERERLVSPIAGSLAQVSRADIIDRSIAHFRNADAEYGARVEAEVKDARSSGTPGAETDEGTRIEGR